eukprot:1860570-Rhodomonas_salina.2
MDPESLTLRNSIFSIALRKISTPSMLTLTSPSCAELEAQLSSTWRVVLAISHLCPRGLPKGPNSDERNLRL